MRMAACRCRGHVTYVFLSRHNLCRMKLKVIYCQLANLHDKANLHMEYLNGIWQQPVRDVCVDITSSGSKNMISHW